jgi:hypothetical protein
MSDSMNLRNLHKKQESDTFWYEILIIFFYGFPNEFTVRSYEYWAGQLQYIFRVIVKQEMKQAETKWNKIKQKWNETQETKPAKYNKTRVCIGDEYDIWTELNDVLRIKTNAEVAKILLDR